MNLKVSKDHFDYLDGRVLAEEARVVLNELEALGLVEEVNELQELLQGELMKRSLVPGHVVIRN